MKKYGIKKIASIFLVICLSVGLFQFFRANAAGDASFKDMDGSEYYAEAVKALAELDIINGYPDKTFRANNTITRAEMCAIALRTQGLEKEAQKAKGKTNYSDVADSHWASGYINKATELDIVQGDGNRNFRPDANVLYEEAVKIIVNAVGYGEEAIAKGGWPDGFIQVAQEKGMLENVPGNKGVIISRGAVALLTYQGLARQIESSESPLAEIPGNPNNYGGGNSGNSGGNSGNGNDNPTIVVHTEFPNGITEKNYIDITYTATPSKGASIDVVYMLVDGSVYKAVYVHDDPERNTLEIGRAHV